MLLTSRKDSAVTVDVEMYDVSNAANALGAYSGERPPDAKVQVTDAGLHHFDRNALYLARGPYYIRVIGSDETPVVADKLKQVAEKMLSDVGGEPLPWAYGLYIGQLGLGADKITYSAKNAFSLAFADDVWAVRPEGKQTDLELFVSARADAAGARQIVKQLQRGVPGAGQAGGQGGGGGAGEGSVPGAVLGGRGRGALPDRRARRGQRGGGGRGDRAAAQGDHRGAPRVAAPGGPGQLELDQLELDVEKDTDTKPAAGAESRPAESPEVKEE